MGFSGATIRVKSQRQKGNFQRELASEPPPAQYHRLSELIDLGGGGNPTFLRCLGEGGLAYGGGRAQALRGSTPSTDVPE